jgi:hypothetical protein
MTSNKVWPGQRKVAAAALLALAILTSCGVTQTASEAVQYQLKVIGASIYESHGLTGRWPSRTDDLAITSITARLRYWKPLIDGGNMVVVWHKKLDADPKNNASVVLVYHNQGLLATMGRQWVCWGDLRTEYMTTKRLREKLGSESH